MSRRHEPVRETVLPGERTCAACGRRALDVHINRETREPTCFPGVGCNTKARALRELGKAVG